MLASRAPIRNHHKWGRSVRGHSLGIVPRRVPASAGLFPSLGVSLGIVMSWKAPVRLIWAVHVPVLMLDVAGSNRTLLKMQFSGF